MKIKWGLLFVIMLFVLIQSANVTGVAEYKFWLILNKALE